MKPIFVYCFNGSDNGGEQLIFSSEIKTSGDDIFTNQEITLHSYCNSASFNLSGAQIDPDQLRDLANKLEKFLIQNGIKT